MGGGGGERERRIPDIRSSYSNGLKIILIRK